MVEPPDTGLERRRLVLGVGAVAVLAVLVALVAIGPGDFFLPEESQTVDETTVAGEGSEVLARGTFSGDGGHEVSGTVTLVRRDGQLYLQFENYRQESGPDVFVYVTPSADPNTSSEIAAGRKVLIDGGGDGGESTKRGTFVQPLPEGVTAEEVNGVGIWCDQFSVSFGTAALSPVEGDGNATTAATAN